MLHDVLGIGISMSAWCTKHYPDHFDFQLDSSNFDKVCVSTCPPSLPPSSSSVGPRAAELTPARRHVDFR
jgi:hypothetical protein